ncbi:MAG: hypothetical protein AAFO04_26310 [Cyanobacteria bacterium J06592_8]
MVESTHQNIANGIKRQLLTLATGGKSMSFLSLDELEALIDWLKSKTA